MNSNNTHLTIVHDKIKYMFTAILGQCQLCPETEEFDFVITTGTNKNYHNWEQYCYNHLNTIASKKQVCNHCNQKSVIRTIPKICQECLTMIIENNYNMNQKCKYPDISRTECVCSFCKVML